MPYYVTDDSLNSLHTGFHTAHKICKKAKLGFQQMIFVPITVFFLSKTLVNKFIGM